MKYPFILFYRDDEHKYVDSVIERGSNDLQCTLHVINSKKQLNNFYKQTYPILIIFETNQKTYEDVVSTFDANFSNRIFRLSEFTNNWVEEFNKLVNETFISVCSLSREKTRPTFSIFTPSFNSFDKIIRAFNSLKSQTLQNWEWVIIDDSPDDVNFKYLTKYLSHDCRIRMYKRFENNGYIGNIKNEAVSLCRGKYLLELDHDDEILPFVLEDSAKLFEEKEEVGFIYMDFINIYENGKNYWYDGGILCKGYGSYYCQKYNNSWVYVYNTPNINNITLGHLVCCPNHPRIWRKDLLLNIGNYCEYLPICDDYEILLKTAVNTKIAKIHKMGYVQYMNDGNNNFSLIRNAEINRIGPNYIKPKYYDVLDVDNEMKKQNAHEDEKYAYEHSNIWKRNTNTYQHKYCNLLLNADYKKQYCIVGLDQLVENIEKITKLYEDTTNDFFIIDNVKTLDYLFGELDKRGLSRMKCFILLNESKEILINYFKVCYLSCSNYEIIKN
jgi:Glycosyltransferases involved in cell wall biogenesis